MTTPQEVLAFWIDEVGPEGWYKSDPALDDEIRSRFLDTWQKAKAGGLTSWMSNAPDVLAYVILTDQFPRNMFRGEGMAFSTDKAALAAAKCAIDKGWDLCIDEPQRQFFYLPLMHSESQMDQDRCVRLMLTRMPKGGRSNLLHAKAHREVIRRFGRFPYRNAALSRTDTSPEQAFHKAGGYGALVRELQA